MSSMVISGTTEEVIEFLSSLKPSNTVNINIIKINEEEDIWGENEYFDEIISKITFLSKRLSYFISNKEISKLEYHLLSNKTNKQAINYLVKLNKSYKIVDDISNIENILNDYVSIFQLQ